VEVLLSGHELSGSVTVRKVSAGDWYWTRETSRIPPPKFTSGYGNIATCLFRGLCSLWVGGYYEFYFASEADMRSVWAKGTVLLIFGYQTINW